MTKVLVTGANGHLGFTLVKLLKSKGYTVKAGVRNMEPGKTNLLRSVGAEVCKADLADSKSLSKALDGCEGLFQVAAVYDITARNPARDVKEPNIRGTANIIKAAHECGVKKIIYTSSTTAVGADAPDGRLLNENDWNIDVVEPYAQSKVDSERLAWKMSEELNMNLVSILPSAMIGPNFFKHTPTTQSFEQLLTGKIPFILPLGFSFVDVRDSAMAHLLAFENKNASGRYIVSTKWCMLKELFETAHNADAQIKLPKKELSVSSLKYIPFLDWLGNKLTGSPRFATKKFIKEYAGKKALFTSEKIRTDLQWETRPFADSVADTIDWVKNQFIQKAA